MDDVFQGSATIKIFARLQHTSDDTKQLVCSATIKIFARLQLSPCVIFNMLRSATIKIFARLQHNRSLS